MHTLAGLLKSVKQHNVCLICGSEELQAKPRYEAVNLCQCKSCGFVFSRNIPSWDEISEYYADDYELTSYISPITVKRYHELLDTFESERKTNKILDIGAGYGFFLEIAKERGWEVFGTEITQNAVEICRSKGIQMFEGPLHQINFDNLQFDVVVSIEVLEHINTPKEFVGKINDLLRPGGLFYLSTPNFDAALRYYLGNKYDVIEYPNHLCYYTKKTLALLMENHGFETLNIRTTGISFTRIKTSKGKSDQDYVAETSDDEMLRYKIEKNGGLRAMKTAANGMLNLLKAGDSLKGTFRKKIN